MANEKRLIDANRLRNIFNPEAMCRFDSTVIQRAIDDSPTVDAVEVVHGSWAFIGENCCVCSVCHKHSIVDYHFCPECGANMDMEVDK